MRAPATLSKKWPYERDIDRKVLGIEQDCNPTMRDVKILTYAPK